MKVRPSVKPICENVKLLKEKGGNGYLSNAYISRNKVLIFAMAEIA